MPDTLAIDRIGEVWHQVRKHAAIAIVFDKSGCMADSGKITYAVKGAQEFVRRMEPTDTLLWMPFDSEIYAPVTGLKSQIGEQLISTIGGTPAEGGTALYDAVLSAYAELSKIRATEGDSLRYGIVVLSDGQDQNSDRRWPSSRPSCSRAKRTRRASRSIPSAIGEDADETMLKKIAQAAHGRFWKPKRSPRSSNVYKDIAAYF